MNREEIVVQGPFSAFATSNGCRAEVRHNDLVVQKFSSETAWSDAVREAEDRNIAAAH